MKIDLEIKCKYASRYVENPEWEDWEDLFDYEDWGWVAIAFLTNSDLKTIVVEENDYNGVSVYKFRRKVEKKCCK